MKRTLLLLIGLAQPFITEPAQQPRLEGVWPFPYAAEAMRVELTWRDVK